MSDDIAERLRQPLRAFRAIIRDYPDGHSEGPFDPLMLEAADLIERLQAESASAYHRGRVAGLREAADEAYLAVLKAESVPRYTRTLRLKRPTYGHEYAAAAKDALRSAADKLEAETP